jgi:hypothetical protein
LAPTTEVGCGLQKNSTFSEKRAKALIIFFLYFPDFFGNFDETKQGFKFSILISQSFTPRNCLS